MIGAGTRQPERRATIADLYAIPEELRRHELVDGEIVEKGAATGEHGAAQAGVVIVLGSRFGRRPDVVGWRRERVAQRPTGTPIHERPDWVCEILSTNRRHDLVKKKRAYHREKVPHYWILAAQRGERVRAEPFDAVELHVGAFFGDDEVDDEE